MSALTCEANAELNLFTFFRVRSPKIACSNRRRGKQSIISALEQAYVQGSVMIILRFLVLAIAALVEKIFQTELGLEPTRRVELNPQPIQDNRPLSNERR